MMAWVARKWLVVALFVSLMLNLFLGGIFVSKWLFHRNSHLPRLGSMKRMVIAAESLGDNAKKKATEIHERHGTAIHEGMIELRKARREFNQQLVAKTLDHPRLEQVTTELTTRSREAKERIYSMMIEIATTLSPDDRILYFEQLRSRHGKGHQKNRQSLPHDNKKN